MEARAPSLAARAQPGTHAPEQSVLVACLMSASGGFLDAFTWLSLGGVFANSQTGNVVFLGIYAATGQWLQAAHHIPPILAFILGAWVATIVDAPLLCLAGEIFCLSIVMLLLHRLAEPAAIIGLSFGGALQTASFRQVGRSKYLSVTVTGNMLRGIEQLVAFPDREATLAARTMLAVCGMFLLGAAVGGWLTMRLAGESLVVPFGLLALAFGLCGWPRVRKW